MKPEPGCPAARWLVIGYGNPLRGDDAAGSVVAARLAALALPGVTIATPHQLVPELAPQLATADRVLFVDASHGAAVAIERILPDPSATGLGHAATPGRLLALAADLYQARPPAWLVKVPARHWEIGAGLSETTATAIGQAVAEILDLLATRRSRPG